MHGAMAAPGFEDMEAVEEGVHIDDHRPLLVDDGPHPTARLASPARWPQTVVRCAALPLVLALTASLVCVAWALQSATRAGVGARRSRTGPPSLSSAAELLSIDNFTRALVMTDANGTGDATGNATTMLVARKGDVVLAKSNLSNWTYVYTKDGTGFLPSKSLNMNSTQLIANFRPSSTDVVSQKLLPVQMGEMVWIINSATDSEWTYVAKPGIATGGTGEINKGYVPDWYLANHKDPPSSKSSDEEDPASTMTNSTKYSRLYEIEGIVSLADAEKHEDDQGSSNEVTLKNATLSEEQHGGNDQLSIDNLMNVLVTEDVDAKNDSSRLSAKKGDAVMVLSIEKNWTYAYTAKASGYLPSSVLNANSTEVIADFTSPSTKIAEASYMLPVERGDTVWILSDNRTDWAFVARRASKTGDEGGLLQGYVPTWALASHQDQAA